MLILFLVNWENTPKPVAPQDYLPDDYIPNELEKHTGYTEYIRTTFEFLNEH